MRRDEHRCQHCGEPANSIDHIVPRSQGGTFSWLGAPRRVLPAVQPVQGRLHAQAIGAQTARAAARAAAGGGAALEAFLCALRGGGRRLGCLVDEVLVKDPSAHLSSESRSGLGLACVRAGGERAIGHVCLFPPCRCSIRCPIAVC